MAAETLQEMCIRDSARPSRRDLLRAAIDAALEEKPADFDALLSLVSGAGYALSLIHI